MDNSWGFIISVTLTGLIVVFSALVLLVLIIMVFSKAGEAFGKGSEKKEDIKTAPKVPEKPVSAAKPAVQQEDDGEIIAVITAAIEAMRSAEGITGGFKIRSVKQTSAVPVRKAWSMAGISDNTRPF